MKLSKFASFELTISKNTKYGIVVAVFSKNILNSYQVATIKGLISRCLAVNVMFYHFMI